MKDEIAVRELKNKEPIPYNLLLIADPSKSNIDKYISDSVIYMADFKGQTAGCYVLCNAGRGTTEIKNIAVDEKFQGKGFGTFLLHDAIKRAKWRGFKKIIKYRTALSVSKSWF